MRLVGFIIRIIGGRWSYPSDRREDTGLLWKRWRIFGSREGVQDILNNGPLDTRRHLSLEREEQQNTYCLTATSQHCNITCRRKLYYWDNLITAFHLQRLRTVESAVCCEHYVRKIIAETGRDILKKIIVHNSLDELKNVKLQKKTYHEGPL